MQRARCEILCCVPPRDFWVLNVWLGNAFLICGFPSGATAWIHNVYYERVVRSAAMFRRFNFSFLGISSSARQQTHTVRVIARGSFPVCLCRERTPSPRSGSGCAPREPFWILKRDSAPQRSLIFVSPHKWANTCFWTASKISSRLLKSSRGTDVAHKQKQTLDCKILLCVT